MASLGGVQCLNSNNTTNSRPETTLIPTKIRGGFPAHSIRFLSKLNHRQQQQIGIRLRCSSAVVDSAVISDMASVFDQQPGYLAKLGEAMSGFEMNVKKVEEKKKEPTSQELDQLMVDSVAEIVKNIRQAPLLVHVYSEEGSRSSSLKLVVEKAESEAWPVVKERWSVDNSVVPDGVILVEELDDGQNNSDTLDSRASSNGSLESSSSSTKLWGLLVQGRGLNCPSCYILKTCQVQCCFGFSTHFSLSKVDPTGQSLDFHTRKWWLQR